MSAAAEKQRRQYLATQITTASKEQLVVMLFDGIARFCENARVAYSAKPKRIEEGSHAIQRAQAIVMELIYTLDREKGGDVAENLARLHAYAFKCLLSVTFHHDLAKIAEVVNIYSELREAWVAAMGAMGLSTGVAPASAPVGEAEAGQHASAASAPFNAAPEVAPAPKPIAGYGLNMAAIAAAAAKRAAAIAGTEAASDGAAAPKPVLPLHRAALAAFAARAAKSAPDDDDASPEDAKAATGVNINAQALAAYARRFA